MTSPVPAVEQRFIPARFRVFTNYDLPNTGVGGKEVQPRPQRALVYQNSYGGFQEGNKTLTDDKLLPGPG